MVQMQTTLRDSIQMIEDEIRAEQLNEAMASCQQLLARYPDALDIQRLLGEIYMAQGRLEEAQQTFDWILVNDPENVIVYCDRALLCQHLQDFDTALDCYQQAYELSRGNSQIRRGFNQLSAQVGQQEFMLSRAGLARLYMRGDLLTQAFQEWEAVLATAPDRLDARLGLLETWWRDGSFDKVERLAQQILEEYSGCLKALLLLAHVTSAFNMQRARELLQRAAAFDPELVMAQDLFSDLLASQPHDPFLTLIRQGSITLFDQEDANGKSIEMLSTAQYATIRAQESPQASSQALADRVYNWSAQDHLSELDTRSVPQSGAQLAEQFSSSSTETPTGQHPVANPQQEQAIVDDYETWAAQQEIDDDFDPSILERQPWFQAESSALSTESTTSDSQPSDETPSWSAFLSREEAPAPPAWLDMLTKNEKSHPGEAVQPPQGPAKKIVEEAGSAKAAQPEPSAPSLPSPLLPVNQSWDEPFGTPGTFSLSPSSSQEIEPSFFIASSDQEEDMGWPEWLKSLGAETLETAPQFEVTPTLESSPAGVSPAHRPPEQSEERRAEEARQLAALEALERSLYAEGFVPLEPGSLSVLSQAQSEASSAPLPAVPAAGNAVEENVALPASQEELAPPLVEQPEQEQPWWAMPWLPPSAPSAPTITPGVGESVVLPAAQMPVEVIPPALEQLPAALASSPPQPSAPDVPVAPPPVPAFTQTPVQMPAPISPPAPAPVPVAVAPESPAFPSYRPDALLDNELETTMKRPAVRLQHVKPGSGGTGQLSTSGKGRGERASGETNLSNKERLVRGYQYQLAGDYDDAMQEYRAIIRNAPELLGEVISNVRALLKLAPKYTAGYRVLGDAYMRQGEYLQAMEAYNKALTIAKKAKSQSR